ncbi:MAG TPA: hypothetical protein PLR83_09965 [Pyrinomonadaceae bacterium]|nr:hypothetical protein [Pyrinomonadaceae bacterium]
MVTQTNPDLKHTFDSKFALSDSRPDPVSQKLNDDIIASLARMPENRRARQVGEWEMMRRRTFKLPS